MSRNIEHLTNFGGRLKKLTSHLALLVLVLPSLLWLSGCQEPQLSKLEQIKRSGILRIATRNSPTTYYVRKDGPAGIEYELATAFADHLGVTPVFVAQDNIGQIFNAIDAGSADIAAAGLSATHVRKQNYLFGPPYQEVSAKLIFKQGNDWPRHFGQLDGDLKVIANSSHSRMLLDVKQDFPQLSWSETDEHSPEELLDMVLDGTIDYTIVDSVELNLNRRFKTELAIAFTVGEPQQLAWALPKDGDYSVLSEVVSFFGGLQQSGKIAQLVDQYYGHVDDFDYVGARTFMKAAQTDLEQYRELFQASAPEGIDWRLLAAMGYQESHWDPKAKSHTGVRGLMMLTLDTARQLGIKSRLDPEQSIAGGAEYFQVMHQRIPERIAEPDRTWMALAAYNVGWGHLEDARIITERLGGDPDKWVDVKEHLPLLKQKKYYKQTKYGYARGDEPVDYVTNIRRYYDVLVWLDEDKPEYIDLLDAGEMVADNQTSRKQKHDDDSNNIIESESSATVD
ncbi:membrane-bound lytic murein transglycosylase MltF [Pleionea mediterranea]|uniref:Membrane-bound lytic murein transglycosylase F n=1 Tax=Pleionea mediterranea TaxID=523701 RepID=A0A316FPN6_9GAMM|nr:membrane-bound lytic murein transglycosylase MltF [Pleionea mediterranea]PWK50741.1 membrane-bound lytic murein transglycosylase F [Pleionea mediterranea]